MKKDVALELARAIDTLIHYAVISPGYSNHRMGAIQGLAKTLGQAFPEPDNAPSKRSKPR